MWLKTLTPQWQSDNDQFADNSEEDVEEVDISLSSTNLRSADDIDLLGGSEGELQQLRLEKTADDYSMEISDGKSKILATASSQCHPPTYW